MKAKQYLKVQRILMLILLDLIINIAVAIVFVLSGKPSIGVVICITSLLLSLVVISVNNYCRKLYHNNNGHIKD
jgi:tryptophan-rich sensory protein